MQLQIINIINRPAVSWSVSSKNGFCSDGSACRVNRTTPVCSRWAFRVNRGLWCKARLDNEGERGHTLGQQPAAEGGWGGIDVYIRLLYFARVSPYPQSSGVFAGPGLFPQRPVSVCHYLIVSPSKWAARRAV